MKTSVLKISSWEKLFDLLHQKGWSLGWKAYASKNKRIIWSVDGHKANFHLMAEGKSLAEAFWQLYYSILAVEN